MDGLTILVGDCREQLRTLAPESVDCVVTSPPYFGLRDYGVDGQIGREPSLKEYVAALVEVFGEVRKALKPTGTVWLNLGDCYATTPAGSTNVKVVTRDKGFQFRHNPASAAQVGKAAKRDWAGLKPKDLMMVPARVALALQDDGWWVRSEITWAKAGGGMPEPAKDRPSASTEKIWLLTKAGSGYYYDHEASALPVAAATEDGIRRAVRDLENDSVPERDWKAATERRDDRVTSARGRAQVFAAMLDHQGKHAPERTDPGINSTRGKAEAMARLAPRHKYAGKEMMGWMHEDGSFGRDRITRRLRNYEPAPEEVWEICPASFPGAHFATFPAELVERALTAGCPPGGTVLDPFGGAGTTALVALHTGRQAVLCELSEEYAELARRRVESGGRLDSDMRRQRHAERKRAEREAHGQGSLI